MLLNNFTLNSNVGQIGLILPHFPFLAFISSPGPPGQSLSKNCFLAVLSVFMRQVHEVPKSCLHQSISQPGLSTVHISAQTSIFGSSAVELFYRLKKSDGSLFTQQPVVT